MIKPVGDQVLLLLDTESEQRKGSLYVVGERNYLEGIVQAVGDDVFYRGDKEPTYSPGDRVIIKERPDKEEEYVRVIDEGDIFIFAEAHHILGVLTKEAANVTA